MNTLIYTLIYNNTQFAFIKNIGVSLRIHSKLCYSFYVSSLGLTIYSLSKTECPNSVVVVAIQHIIVWTFNGMMGFDNLPTLPTLLFRAHVVNVLINSIVEHTIQHMMVWNVNSLIKWKGVIEHSQLTFKCFLHHEYNNHGKAGLQRSS